ncbi:hypothetical protein AYI70_g1049 [Smittium culicis]|uniref:Uncharacterized protein n=1 Tax=Smittium culicis TaxID=133412 RepID=A0A1R1YEB4_9FUNG|nr:hypothetical protein AYI70_g12093 [Smittium culicis]OMJ14934.1 hypothetical protein AYI70_g7591 [Smittium culicis]OMJ25220.1 hypothetical protein AYI70_g1049 [Smittium culicis]
MVKFLSIILAASGIIALASGDSNYDWQNEDADSMMDNDFAQESNENMEQYYNPTNNQIFQDAPACDAAPAPAPEAASAAEAAPAPAPAPAASPAPAPAAAAVEVAPVPARIILPRRRFAYRYRGPVFRRTIYARRLAAPYRPYIRPYIRPGYIRRRCLY